MSDDEKPTPPPSVEITPVDALPVVGADLRVLLGGMAAAAPAEFAKAMEDPDFAAFMAGSPMPDPPKEDGKG